MSSSATRSPGRARRAPRSAFATRLARASSSAKLKRRPRSTSTSASRRGESRARFSRKRPRLLRMAAIIAYAAAARYPQGRRFDSILRCLPDTRGSAALVRARCAARRRCARARARLRRGRADTGRRAARARRRARDRGAAGAAQPGRHPGPARLRVHGEGASRDRGHPRRRSTSPRATSSMKGQLLFTPARRAAARGALPGARPRSRSPRRPTSARPR